MRVRVYFRGGSFDGQMAVVQYSGDIIGAQIKIDGVIYEIQDGPIARVFQDTQQGHENLCVVARVVDDEK